MLVPAVFVSVRVLLVCWSVSGLRAVWVAVVCERRESRREKSRHNHRISARSVIGGELVERPTHLIYQLAGTVCSFPSSRGRCDRQDM